MAGVDKKVKQGSMPVRLLGWQVVVLTAGDGGDSR
jgi:hypothetical protein